MKKLLCLALALTFALTTRLTAQESIWDRVKEKMTCDLGYSVLCDYSGPEGQYFFSYVVHGNGDRILTEVLDGSTRGVGTRIYYDPSKDAENVHMQTRLFRLRRSLQARDIKDTPLYQPLFSHLLDEVSKGAPQQVESGETTLLRFGGTESQHEFLEVDAEGNPIRLRRMTGDKEVNSLTFHKLEWGEKPMNWKI